MLYALGTLGTSLVAVLLFWRLDRYTRARHVYTFSARSR
jgi:hypothetical protein